MPFPRQICPARPEFHVTYTATQLRCRAQTPYGPHLWDKPVDPTIFENLNEQLDLAQKSVDQLLAVRGRAPSKIL
jgi:hypothetical protein